MVSIKKLSEQTGKPVKLLRATAMQYGFTGAIGDELPEDIETKLTGPKQLGAAPPKETERRDESTGNTGTSTGQGLNDIYEAFYTAPQNLQKTQFEVEKEAAIAQGRMWGHQLYLNMVGARNETLQTLIQQDLQGSMTNHQEAAEDYQAFIEEKRQKALSAWASSDKEGKSLQQALGELKALNASFDI